MFSWNMKLHFYYFIQVNAFLRSLSCKEASHDPVLCQWKKKWISVEPRVREIEAWICNKEFEIRGHAMNTRVTMKPDSI
jgi:hypothetical protein